MIILGLGHKKQQGKDTLADELTEALRSSDPLCRPFAVPLKMLAMQAFGLTYDQCYGTDKKKNEKTLVTESTLGISGETMLLTAREVLQKLGIKMREQFPGIWKRAPFRVARQERSGALIIPDVRFEDEAYSTQERGGLLIRVIRPGHELWDTNESETALDGFRNWDITWINDGELVDVADVAEIIVNWAHIGWTKDKMLVVRSSNPEPEFKSKGHYELDSSGTLVRASMDSTSS